MVVIVTIHMSLNHVDVPNLHYCLSFPCYLNKKIICIKFYMSGEWITILELILIKMNMNKTGENKHANKAINSQR